MSKRKIILTIIAALLVISSTYLFSKTGRTSAETPPSKVSIDIGDIAPTLGMKNTDQLITFWKQRYENDPRDYISLTYLGTSYLRKGRETGDASNYEEAEVVLRKSTTINPNYELTQAYLSASLFVKHDFLNALDIANRVYTKDPRALQALATVGDAQLELGRYTEAENSYQTLADKSPSAPVFSRLARLTWLEGDPAGALALMQKAVQDNDSTEITGENAAWYHLQLGELYFNTGQLQQAEMQYEVSLKAFDNYYLALAGLGKVSAAQGHYKDAIAYYEKAVAVIPQPDLLAALGDIYTAAGYPDKAKKEYATVQFIGKLQAINKVIYNRQLALFFANHNQNINESLTLAQQELVNRKDIYAYDTYAWALYKNQRYTEANAAIQQAMKLGTRDAMLYYHAGMIDKALGDTVNAKKMLAEALTINPHFDLMQARIAQTTLAVLQTFALR
jgi:tetratricopeptide (TPR) repeat protein